ncbi:MAG: hypothetical protein JO205_08805 [Pseudolabrys sp.]|nr:hypothetical protein [Pseudolabrys sp.]
MIGIRHGDARFYRNIDWVDPDYRPGFRLILIGGSPGTADFVAVVFRINP